MMMMTTIHDNNDDDEQEQPSPRLQLIWRRYHWLHLLRPVIDRRSHADNNKSEEEQI